MKIPFYRNETRKLLKANAHLFPVGIQFANIMVEDKKHNLSADGFNKAHAQLPFYKKISRIINPDTNE